MGMRKVDNRVRILIENGVTSGYRTLFVLVGDKSREQVVYLHHMLSKTCLKQASVLWCYKNELSFSSHRKKRMKQLKAKVRAGQTDVNEDDPFEMFVSMTEIRYTYYKDTHKILGNTFKMCVIQDFETMTPNLLCRTIETVEGGGMICILLQSVTSLKQLFTLNMDVHARFRTEAHQVIVPRFNERFLLSLSSCPACIVLDDQLRILPISSAMKDLQPLQPLDTKKLDELKAMKEATKDSPPIGILIGICKTADQARVVLEFIMSITEKSLDATVTLTAARGRGKSAAMGIALASAISFGYSNIYVTSPSPENLNTFFEFLLKGLGAIGYEEHSHYQVIRSSDASQNKAVLKIIITRDHRQVIQYISPRENDCLGQAELLVIDEAAAIPLPVVENLLGRYLVFMSSTVSGYEGTGRSLSLKLIQRLREESKASENEDNKSQKGTKKEHRKLVELSLSESIRYKPGDLVEKWLNDLLCLEASPPPLVQPIEDPTDCTLYYVNRDTLFGYHEISEEFLSNCMGLLVSSHYRNTPNDLQTLSDAPSHHLFVLTGKKIIDDKFPFVICVLQVSFEGKLAKTSLESGSRNPGDMIPWTVGNLFLDDQFPKLSGLRIVRIATHPDLQGRGYGSKAMEYLEQYYRTAMDRLGDSDPQPKYESGVRMVTDEEVSLLEETLLPQPPKLPLLSSLDSRPAEYVDYLGVAFGASFPLLTFWKRAGFQCLYLSQVTNTLTGENTNLMLKTLKKIDEESWLETYYYDFRRRTVTLLSGPFRKLECKLALSILMSKIFKNNKCKPNKTFKFYWNKRDQFKLGNYVRNQVDVYFIMDLIPKIAKLFFLDCIVKCKLKALHMVILCGIGLQRKEFSDIAEELNLTKAVVMEQMNALLRITESCLELTDTLCDEANIQEMDVDKSEQTAAIAMEVVNEVRRDILNQDDDPDIKQKIIEQVDTALFNVKGKEAEFAIKHSSKQKKRKRKLEKLTASEDKS